MELKEVDLSRGDGHKHPDIKLYPTQYLVKIGQGFYAGTFTEVWFGLSFNGWNGTPYQYDSPGTNSSDWKRIWEIIETEEEKSQMSIREVRQQERQNLYNSLTKHERDLIDDGDYILDQILKHKEKRIIG